MPDEPLDRERALLARGEPMAFAAFYDRHAPGMLAVARAMLGSQADAEDAVQQTFLNLFQARRGFSRAQSPRAYAFAALRNAALRIRDRRRDDVLPEDVGGAEPSTEEDFSGRQEQLERALSKLPAEQREVLALKFDADLTFAEIGAALEISPNTAASRYRYALERLSQTLRANS